MARPGIGYEDVAQAANALLANGKTPTIAAVREALGNTGSPNTVHKFLTRWKEHQHLTRTETAPALPSKVIDAINTEIERARAEAIKHLEEELIQEKAESRELARAGEAIEAEHEELNNLVVSLTSQRDTAAATAAERLNEIERQTRQIHTEQREAEAARMTLAKADLKIEAQAEKLKEQNNEVLNLRNELAATAKERGEAYKAAAVMAAQLEAAERRATEAEAREKATAGKLDRTEQELSNARVHIQAQHIALDTASREITNGKKAASVPGKKAPAKKEAAQKLI